MAYDRKKILAYGTIGVIIALAVIAFIPVNEEVHVSTYITLDQIPGYGLQFVKVSEDQTDLTHVSITIHTVEAQLLNGEWVKVSENDIIWDLIRETQISFELDSEEILPGKYSKIRFYISGDLNKSNVTLSDDQVIPLTLHTNPVEVDIPEIDIVEGMDELSLTLTVGSGISSTHVIPGYHIEILTNKLGGMITSP